jgi:hypothetical protein
MQVPIGVTQQGRERFGSTEKAAMKLCSESCGAKKIAD